MPPFVFVEDKVGLVLTGLRAEDDSGVGHIETPQFEQELPPENRAPRVTMSHWRFKAGGLGSLTHTISLHVGLTTDTTRKRKSQTRKQKCANGQTPEIRRYTGASSIQFVRDIARHSSRVEWLVPTDVKCVS